MKIHHSVSVDISVSFPALDRLVDFLQSSQQPEVDALTAQVGGVIRDLKASGDELNQAVKTKSNT